MFFRSIFLFACFTIVLVSCKNNDSNQTLLSAIDGNEHAVILEGKSSVDKNTLLILYNRMAEVDLITRIYISDSLFCSDTVWQNHYLHAVFKICKDLNQDEKQYVGPNLFYYFLHHPKRFYLSLSDLPLYDSDCLLSLIGQEIKQNIHKDGITINSIKNLTFSNCTSCSDNQIFAIQRYIDLADKMYYE